MAPGPGLSLVEVDPPALRPGTVRVRVEHGSVCGTDLHIDQWDAWAAHRMLTPRIVGHEFCGTVVEVAPDVTERTPGDFVASESHVVCGTCLQCRSGQAHVCLNTQILGVDIDGGFVTEAVIPWENARPVPAGVPRAAASMQDALGNAVHTVLAGPVEDRDVLITGLGPIGLFAAAVCRALGARRVIGTEVSPYRIRLAEALGVDVVVNPAEEDAVATLARLAPGGVDAVLEMSGHPASFALALESVRPGGRVSLLGVYHDRLDQVDLNRLIFKGVDVQGIVGRRLWETWDQMAWLQTERGLDITPIITHRFPFTQVNEAMAILREGQAGKIVFDF